MSVGTLSAGSVRPKPPDGRHRRDGSPAVLSVQAQPNWTLPYLTEDAGARRLLKIAAVALWALNLADVVTTYWALHYGAHESNPLAALLLRSYAIIPFKLLLCGIVTWGAWAPHRSRLHNRQIAQAWFAVGVYTLAIYSNSMHLWMLTR